MGDWLADVLAGKRRAIARAITRVENESGGAGDVVAALYKYTGNAHVVGVTGSPGSGKSTLVNELAKALRQEGLTIGIIAVDPSSPFTGGALLGDRIRMRDLSGDDGIFIRSMASRGSLGGLAQTTSGVVKVLDAGGFDIVLVETVGAGQAEVDIADAAHTTLVIEAPGMGDEIQSIKAGILEIADILVVNKADRPGVRRTVKALEMMLHLNPAGGTMRHHGRRLAVAAGGDVASATPSDEAGWDVPIVQTIATQGEGIEALAAAVQAHAAYLRAGGEWQKREMERSRQEIKHLLQAHFMARLAATVPAAEREQLIAAVAARELDPYTAVDRLFAQMAPQPK